MQKSKNLEKHLLYLSSEICVAGHICARISIGLHENKENKHFRYVYPTQNTLRNETELRWFVFTKARSNPSVWLRCLCIFCINEPQDEDKELGERKTEKLETKKPLHPPTWYWFLRTGCIYLARGPGHRLLCHPPTLHACLYVGIHFLSNKVWRLGSLSHHQAPQ